MSGMEEIIRKAIETDANLSRTMKVLNTGDEWAIAKRFEEEYVLSNGKSAKDDHTLRFMLSSPKHLNVPLQIWVKSDLLAMVKKQTDKEPDEVDFVIALHEVLGELRLFRAMSGGNLPEARYMQPPPLPTGIEKFKPRTMRW